MATTGGRVLALTRGLVVAATTLALGAGSHVVAGGSTPSPVVLIVLGSLLLVAGLAVGRRRLRARTLAPLAALSQVLVHTVLPWAHQGHGAARLGAHGHGSAPMGWTPAVESTPTHLSGTMLAAHAAATALTVLALLGADRAAARARHWWSGVLVLVRASPVCVPSGPAVRPGARPLTVPLRQLARSVQRRGPPVGLAAA